MFTLATTSKKIGIFFILTILSTISASKLHHNGIPSQALLRICQLTGLKSTNNKKFTTLAAINNAAQQDWLRKPGIERWEISPLHEDKRDALLIELAACGFIGATKPEQTNFDYIFITSGLQTSTKKRITYVADLIDKKLIFYQNPLVLLATARPTIISQENMNLGSTETESMLTLYQKSPLAPHPYQLTTLPMKQNATGKLVRAVVDDLIMAWVNEHKQITQQTHVLVVSDQPFVTRDITLFTLLLPRNFVIHQANPSADENISISAYLSTQSENVLFPAK